MKKLISLVCVALLLCTMTATALANVSPAVVEPDMTAKDEIDAITNPIFKQIAQRLNFSTGSTPITTKIIENLLKGRVEIVSGSLSELEGAVLASHVNTIKDGKMSCKALVGAEDVSKFTVMVMLPDGNVAFVKLTADMVDADGNVTLPAPYNQGFGILLRK